MSFAFFNLNLNVNHNVNFELFTPSSVLQLRTSG